MLRYPAFCVVAVAFAGLLFCTRAASADCAGLSGDANSISAQAKGVQTSESAGDDLAAKTAWNAMNHYALAGAEEFKSCEDTRARLSYSISFADATAVGMHYGLLPWSEGTADIGASLQIIDALPHSPAVAQEWNLVHRLYAQTCAMHGAACKALSY